MSGTKKYVPTPSLVTKKDLDGIKKALLFFIERERDKEMSKELDYTFSGMWQNNECRKEYQTKVRRTVNKKYDTLVKGLK